MIKIVDECVGCPPNMGCMGSACPYKDIPILVCDDCGDEGVGYLYELDGEWLCEDCVKSKLPNRVDEEGETEYLYDDEWLIIDELLDMLPTQSENDLDWYEGL